MAGANLSRDEVGRSSGIARTAASRSTAHVPSRQVGLEKIADLDEARPAGNEWQARSLLLPIVGQIFLHDFGVTALQDQRPPRLAQEFGRAFDHAVQLTAMLRLHFASSRGPEALLGTTLRLQLGH